MKRKFIKYPSSISASSKITASNNSDTIEIIKQIIDECVDGVVCEVNDRDWRREYVGEAFCRQCIYEMEDRLLNPEWLAEYAEYSDISIPKISEELVNSPEIQAYLDEAFDGFGG